MGAKSEAKAILKNQGQFLGQGLLSVLAALVAVTLKDTDGDGIADLIDSDDDGDGVPDKIDSAPRDPSVTAPKPKKPKKGAA